MWTRYHIKCNSCEKTTNLRIQIPEKKVLRISYNCIGCASEIKATLKTDFTNAKWEFTVERGLLVNGDFDGGDFYHEFSDTLSTRKPSEKPHSIVMPTMRIPTQEFKKLKLKKDIRKFHSDEEWENLKDLTRAYIKLDFPIIEKLSHKILEKIYPKPILECKIELDFYRNYFFALNYLIYPWIDFENHAEFVEWLNDKIFNKINIDNNDLLDYVNNVVDRNVCDKIRIDTSELIIRFSDLREYLYYANHNKYNSDEFASINNFNLLKSFYTDCFEFIGQTSQYIFRIQNFYERGNQNNVPSSAPRNITDSDSFASLNNGLKSKILNLSSENILKNIYDDSFDSKLRNGINHFKAKLNNENQIISYFPSIKCPEEEYTISYIDFLNKTLNIFNSVLKIGQLAKMVNVYRSIISNK
ncbi:hypothetical protein [uncultured Elizabethkingia sp.]|uniref:hypothetical protein n=1 Tax=uncultured Elizabethkingia sp. TaxID=432638 RepID=UPI0025942904|nr:hypothetical protein [uncultured Elizabethkingia sp.]